MASWQDVVGQVLEYAPQAGAALGTVVPGVGTVAGGAAGMAIKAIAGLFGIKSPDPTPEEVHAAIAADPEAALKLKKLDYEFAMAMRQADKEEHVAELNAVKEEMASARSRQIEHEKATGKTDTNLYVLAWVIVGGFLSLVGMLLFFAHQGVNMSDSSGILYMLLGTLAASFGSVIGFFFGTSMSSRNKDSLLLNSVPLSHTEVAPKVGKR